MVKVTTPVTLQEIPLHVQDLLTSREVARAEKNFAESDKLRAEIMDLGYQVNDNPGGYKLTKLGDEGKKPEKTYLILFGSGEISPTSVDIYRRTFLTFGKRDIKIALVTTPAGFQPNVARVYGEIKDFLLASLPDFNLQIEIIFANNLFDSNNLEIANQIEGSDVIFLGPGSPTYAVKHLKDSLLLAKIKAQIKNGSSLILASAATITFSKYALPVYEIYKVGEDLHWIDGLDLYKDIWHETTIIPHFNNLEGGEGLDTTHCYIGKDRAAKLFAMLPKDTNLIGIDEHTALIIDLFDQSQLVRGKNTIHKIDL